MCTHKPSSLLTVCDFAYMWSHIEFINNVSTDWEKSQPIFLYSNPPENIRKFLLPINTGLKHAVDVLTQAEVTTKNLCNTPFSVFKFVLQSYKNYTDMSIAYSYTIYPGIFKLRDLLNTSTKALMYKSQNIVRVRKWW